MDSDNKIFFDNMKNPIKEVREIAPDSSIYYSFR
jgi:hypothetical protein